MQSLDNLVLAALQLSTGLYGESLLEEGSRITLVLGVVKPLESDRLCVARPIEWRLEG